jgi:hypothetical protein
VSERCRAIASPYLLHHNSNGNKAKTNDMKNQIKATLVKIYRAVRRWGPLMILALLIPGGSLLALLILHRQHRHAQGSSR